jgi:GTPase involved in cell partitioning and DNA repair
MILLKARTQQQNERESAQAGKGGSGNVSFTSDDKLNTESS